MNFQVQTAMEGQHVMFTALDWNENSSVPHAAEYLTLSGAGIGKKTKSMDKAH